MNAGFSAAQLADLDRLGIRRETVAWWSICQTSLDEFDGGPA